MDISGGIAEERQPNELSIFVSFTGARNELSWGAYKVGSEARDSFWLNTVISDEDSGIWDRDQI